MAAILGALAGAVAVTAFGYVAGFYMTRLSNRLRDRGRLPGGRRDERQTARGIAFGAGLMGLHHAFIGLHWHRASVWMAVVLCVAIMAPSYLAWQRRGSAGAGFVFGSMACWAFMMLVLAHAFPLGALGRAYPSLQWWIVGVMGMVGMVLLCWGVTLIERAQRQSQSPQSTLRP